MLNLASDLLGLIPTPILVAMREAIRRARAIADAIIKRINSYIRDLLGISLFPDRDGFFGYFSDASRFGLDLLSGITAAIGTFIGFAQSIAAAAAELKARYEEIIKCLQSFKDYLDYTNGDASQRREELANLNTTDYEQLIQSQFGPYLRQAEQATQFVSECDAQLETIDGILLARTLDPSLEPIEADPVTESVFRLEAGPPKSKSGKFILSVDGLYYDSQTSGIEPALLELAAREQDLQFRERGFTNSDLWRLEFEPSLGGRGVPTTSEDLKYYFNTILDPKIIDNRPSITKFYDKDELLLSLEGQKDRKVFDVSSELQDLIDAGSSIAVTDNMRQVMISETAQFQQKIDKRKKQIELAVKVPAFLGKGPQFTPGNVPVNDFSYLDGSNFLLDLDKQRSIVIDQADVTGVVLPLEVKFTDKIETNDTVFLNHILLANVAKGEIIDNAPASSAPSIQINTRISEDGLIGLYNYLTAETTATSSVDFKLRNSSRFGDSHDAQIVGTTSSIFDRGLGVAKLDGICELNTADNSVLSSVGSYVRLPEVSEFQDMFYRSQGASVETWIQVPNLSAVSGYEVGDSATSALYRLILSNENTGISDSKVAQDDINNLSKDNGTGITRGIIYGFTRDRRFTQGETPSNSSSDNPTSDLQLVLAPTQSYDSSSVGFIADRTTNCNNDGWRGMTVPVFEKLNGVSLSSCEDEFCQLSLTVDPLNDLITVYLDGVNVAASSYQQVFGTSRAKEVYKAPSVFQNNSFRYDGSSVGVSSVADLSGGPRLDTYFTPWILGGGYTDGNPNGNFMGGEYNGKVSGLRGYLGCTRFYARPLSESEVKSNYAATQKFFKNIDLS
tara:strand:- start:17911 stop:20448 length:2538 start_codon:yes stop_codon:yes gene_type:complete